MLRGRTGEWLGAVARIVAFVALAIALTVALGAVWRLLPAAVRSVDFLQTIVVAAAALGAGAVLIRGADGRSPAALGLALSRSAVRHTLLGLLIGVAALTAAAVALLLTSALAYTGQEGSALGWLSVVAAQAGLFTIAALAEEAVFRGYPFQVIAHTWGPVAATVVSSVAFALAHGANPSVGVFALVNIFLAGVLLAVAYLRTLSLWFATAVHTGWNWAMASLFDLPVSGWQVFDTPLYQPLVEGPAWWSGAMFGPEGGLVGTLAFAGALVAIVRWRRIVPDPAILAARPLLIRSEERSDAA